MRRDVAALFGLVTLGFIYCIFKFFRTELLYVAGFALGFAGLALIWRAAYDLKEEFKIMPGAKRLVTHGIYSKLRHPTYVGLSMLLFGWAMMINSGLMAWIATVVTVFNILRAYIENKILDREFKEYKEYKKKVWF